MPLAEPKGMLAPCGKYFIAIIFILWLNKKIKK
jgi:hypothetical protein